MSMTLENKIDALHNAKVINKDVLSDFVKNKLDNLTEDDVDRLIEIADKLDPGRSCTLEISLLF